MQIPINEGGSASDPDSEASGKSDRFVGPPEAFKGSKGPGNAPTEKYGRITEGNLGITSFGDSSPVKEFQRRWQSYQSKLQDHILKLKLRDDYADRLPALADTGSKPVAPTNMEEAYEYLNMLAFSVAGLYALSAGSGAAGLIAAGAGYTGMVGATLIGAPIMIAMACTGLAVLAAGGSAGTAISNVPSYLHPVSLVVTTVSFANDVESRTAHVAGKMGVAAFDLGRLFSQPIHTWTTGNKLEAVKAFLDARDAYNELRLSDTAGQR